MTDDNAIVFASNGLGDALMTLPTINALCHLFDSVRLITSCNSDGTFEEIYSQSSCRDIVTIDIRETPEGKDFDIQELHAIIDNFQVFICLNEWMPRDVNSYNDFISKFKKSIGCYDIYSSKIIRQNNQHTTDYFFEYAKYFDKKITIDHFRPTFSYSQIATEKVENFRKKLPSKYRILIFHGDSQPEKMIPRKMLDSIITQVLSAHKNLLIIVIGTSYPFHRKFEHERLYIIQNLDFTLTWAFFKVADYFVGVDSVFLHLADFYDIPSLGLFGPTNCDE